MINKILKDIDNEECYYVGTNGCLYQDLDKEELLAIKQEIERLNNIIDKALDFIDKEWGCDGTPIDDVINILKGDDKE